MSAGNSYIRWFDSIALADITSVGGKTASLGEMYQALIPQGIHVPNGFAITSAAYRALIESAGCGAELDNLMQGVSGEESSILAERAASARQLILEAALPAQLQDEMIGAYRQLQAQYGPGLRLAVRSSATAEDLPNASFAGQHESFLNIAGDEELLLACRRCFASLYTDRAISYRVRNGFAHNQVALAIAVMKMVRADQAASGVMFTLDTDSGFRDVVSISSAYGLGENIVQGAIDPDEFYVHKPTFEQGFRRVLRRELGSKQFTMICSDSDVGSVVSNIETAAQKRSRFSINDEEVLRLADYAIKTEKHYSALKGQDCPMDLEWAKDADDGLLYLVQARPETVVSQRPRDQLVRYQLRGKSTVLASGRAVGTAIASGVLRKIASSQELEHFQDGDILLAETTSPDWGPVMRRAGAVITVRGGRTCHAAIVAREFGIPAVVGIGSDVDHLNDGEQVTVSCAKGDRGVVYDGLVPFEKTEVQLQSLAKPNTGMMINLGSPDQAFRLSALPCDGVGLARMEFIVNESIKAHPMALLHPEKITDADQRAALQKLTENFSGGAEFFIQTLAEGIATIAAAFYPRPVIVRTSDFKTNEYAGLLGGADFEPKEENPMIGFRGASRYSHPAYEEGFALECAALKRVRDDMGLTNVKVMIPFCRRVEEGQKVIDAMARHGLARGDNGLQIYMMCEIPNNVILIDQFSQLFDGISIGSNDLTQLTLGVDRDSDIVAFDFDERDPGVMMMLKMAVEGAHRNRIPAGICGQAPSDYPEVAEYLVRLGIDSISLNPDALLATRERVVAIEQQLIKS